jgi:hypothetical protein
MPVSFLSPAQRDSYGQYLGDPSTQELGHEHINLLGRYSFAVPESVARGELRPLRNPADGGR